MAYIIFVGVIRAIGPQPAPQDSVGNLVYYAVAFIVGFREETFRLLIARVGDLIVGPGPGRRSASVAERRSSTPTAAQPGVQPAATNRPAESR